MLGRLIPHIPIVLAYPTVLLSSNLIISVKNAGGFDNGRIERAVDALVVPLFCASLMTLLSNSINGLQNLPMAFYVAYVSFVLNAILGHAQTAVISALLVQLVSGHNRLSALHCAFPVLSLLIKYLEGQSYWQSAVGYFVIAATLTLKNWLSRKALNGASSSRVILCGILFVTGFFLFASGMQSPDSPHSIWGDSMSVQFSMIFVFTGSLVVFLVSWKDSSEESSGEDILGLWRSYYLPSTLGVMTILLQYLSFESLTSTPVADLVLALFVACGSVISKLTGVGDQSGRIEKKSDDNIVSGGDDLSGGHENHHCHDHGHHNGHHATTGKTPPEKVGLFSEMARNEDTRSIFSFLLLNTAFMLIQLLYSFRSKSLGLLSDSLHMALDCTSLFLGLVAGVLSKRQATDRFPFALGHLETLAGFTNGILLLAIVGGILVEAFDRIFNPTMLKETTELLIVSFLGLIVNLVGLFAFDHAEHCHHHSNENMRGIFLHILADTLGSVGVVISTLLTKFFGLAIFDPIASMLIAILILFSSMPLIKSTASIILLKLDDKTNVIIKDALNQIATTPGITGYTTPRFWPSGGSPSSGHGHHHSHHDHNHEHDDPHSAHSHGSKCSHSTHSYNDEDSHGHSHNHDHSHKGHTKDHHHEEQEVKLIGYIHVQYLEGENSTIIKKRVEKIFETLGIKAWIQVESRDSPCWCRTTLTS
ncbi:LAMI_0H19064g1_1 [Lachancea mirantina]|uniref:Zinc transporter n=1 Tax=Lachancea mirantina TaxID=1230905 RepID=A0A1G4KJR5_9SACH|nr:LAMI_0H19064g1_1 [Lachancea mirantina]